MSPFDDGPLPKRHRLVPEAHVRALDHRPTKREVEQIGRSRRGLGSGAQDCFAAAAQGGESGYGPPALDLVDGRHPDRSARLPYRGRDARPSGAKGSNVARAIAASLRLGEPNEERVDV